MMPNLKKLLLNNAPLKATAFIIACCFWALSSSHRVAQKTVSVPVCFYGEDEPVEAPEFIEVTLRGKRDDLRNLDIDKLALHLDAQQLQDGKQLVEVNEENLLLPERIKVVNYSPLNLVVDKKQSTAAQSIA